MLIEPNSIINGDCLDVMKFIPDKSIDSIICDLPYGITACKWDTVIPFEPLWEQYKRIIKPNGAIVLFGSQPFTSALVMSNPKWFKYEWIWEKTKITGVLNAKKQPVKQHENILIFGEGLLRYNPQNLIPFYKITNQGGCSANYGKRQTLPYLQEFTNYPRSILKFASESGLHNTAKPVKLIEYLIKTYTLEGDLILDNTAGSGTLAIAAINTNRRYICIEKDEHYFEVMRDRIANHNPNAPVKPKRTKPKPATEGQLKLF